MDDELFVKKIATLLRQGDASLSQHIVLRLAQARGLAVSAHRSRREGYFQKLQPARVIAANWGVLGMSLVVVVAALWLSLNQGIALDDAMHPEIVPVRAYSDSGFNTWSAPDGSTEED